MSATTAGPSWLSDALAAFARLQVDGDDPEALAVLERLASENNALMAVVQERMYADLDRRYDVHVASNPGIDPGCAAAFAIAEYNLEQRGGRMPSPVKHSVKHRVPERRATHRGTSRRTRSRRSCAARRASGQRSGSDPGDPGPSDSDHPDSHRGWSL